MDWMPLLNGTGIGVVITAASGYFVNKSQVKAVETKARAEGETAAEKAQTESDSRWRNLVLEDSQKQRHDLMDRIGRMEKRCDTLTDALNAERRVNEMLREENAKLREANAQLMQRNEELQFENRSWAQQIAAMREQLALITGRHEDEDANSERTGQHGTGS